MSKEKLEECFKSYLEQANNLGERGFCQDTDDYQEFLKDAIDELFGYMYECGFSANKKQAECYKQALEEIEGIVNKKTEIPICDECAYRNIPECKENCMQDVLGEILDIISKAMEG